MYDEYIIVEEDAWINVHNKNEIKTVHTSELKYKGIITRNKNSELHLNSH